MKVLLNYMQIISIMTTIDYGIPSGATSIIQSGANPLESSLNTSDCILNDVYTKMDISFDMIYFRVLAS